MAEYGMFKTAFRGFCKEDVLAYIDEMLADRLLLEQDLQGQIEGLQQQLAEAKVQQEAVRENERLTEEVRQLKEQTELLTTQVAEVTAQLEQERGEAAAATMRDAELSEQLEQSHQAIATLWEEKEDLLKRVDATAEQMIRLRSLGEEFCHRITELLPEVAAEPVEEQAPSVTEPLVVDTPGASAKPMERWLF